MQKNNRFKLINGFKDKSRLDENKKVMKKNLALFNYSHSLLQTINGKSIDEIEIKKAKYKFISLIIHNSSLFLPSINAELLSNPKMKQLEIIESIITHQLILLSFLRDFNVKELSSIFPVMKVYDGNKYNCRDYYSKKEIIDIIGSESANIGTFKNAFLFVFKYPNELLLDLGIDILTNLSYKYKLMNIDFSIIDYLESRGVTGYHLENLNETSEAKLLVDNNGKFQSIINNDFNENKEVLKKELYIVK